MASIIKVDRILDSTELGKVDIPGGVETTELIADTWKNIDGTENYKCKCWVNFDGTTTPPTVRASGNVSSVARNATGDYTVNFIIPMEDANYIVTMTAGPASDTANTTGGSGKIYNTSSMVAGSVRVQFIFTTDTTSGLFTPKSACLCIHR